MNHEADQLLSIENGRSLRSGFHLGEVTIDPGCGTASGPGGNCHLDPKVMDVLVCLAMAGGELVSREMLMRQIWGDVIVTDFALSRCIYQLRKQLSQAAGVEQSPIETLPKRGYRLVWPVLPSRACEFSGPAPRSRAKSLGFTLAGLAVAVVATVIIYRAQVSTPGEGPPSRGGESVRLAVFPLDDLSDDRSQRVFARGVSQELIHELARLPGLIVMGRNSAFNSDRDDLPQLERAGRLGVNYELGGSVRLIGNSRRLLFYLQSVPDGAQVWSHSVLLEPGAPFLALRQISDDVASLLQFSVNPAHKKSSTDNLEAFELFLAAYDATLVETRRSLLQRAVELDPDFADAWTALASIEVIRVWNGEETIESAWARCEPYLQRAMEIDPASPWIYVELGRFKREFHDTDAAIALFRKALELDPGNVWASANLGLVLRSTGRFEEALAIHEQDVALDPLDALAHVRLGTSYWFMENFEAAEHQYRLARELNPLNEEIYDSWSGMLGAGLGRFDEALRMLQRKMTLEKPPTLRSLSYAAFNAGVLGLDEVAEAYWKQADQTAQTLGSLAGDQALYYLGRNEDGEAETDARNALAMDREDYGAQLVLAILDTENGRKREMAERLNSTYSYLMDVDPAVFKTRAESALLLAYGQLAASQMESFHTLLDGIVRQLTPAHGREHVWLAAAYAMRGDAKMAMQELMTSPPGRVRLKAALLMRDPRFAALRDLPEFQNMVQEHLDELEHQRISFLSDPNLDESRFALWSDERTQ